MEGMRTGKFSLLHSEARPRKTVGYVAKRIYRLWPVKLAMLCMALCLLASCGGGNVIGPVAEESALEFLRQGWNAYKLGNYTDAITKFDMAKKLDPNLGEAFNGLGWAYFGQLNLPLAESNFVISNSIDSTKVDPMVGSVFVSYERNKYQDALSWSNRLFAADSAKFLGGNIRYVFQYNSRADAWQVHKLVALCHYYLGDFVKAYDHVRLYLNPALELNTEVPGFAQQLLEEIKNL